MASEYLLKTEPSEYSFDNLVRDKETVWDGVHNPVALRNLREMQPGAKLVIYETGDRKSAVGTATVVSVDTSNPKNPAVKIKAGKAIRQTGEPGADQGQQTLRRFAPGAAGPALSRAADCGAIQVPYGLTYRQVQNTDTITNGGVGEWLKPAVLKTVGPERVPGVRIPPPPPDPRWTIVSAHESREPERFFVVRRGGLLRMTPMRSISSCIIARHAATPQ